VELKCTWIEHWKKGWKKKNTAFDDWQNIKSWNHRPWLGL
jgi:hypothetical protein